MECTVMGMPEYINTHIAWKGLMEEATKGLQERRKQVEKELQGTPALGSCCKYGETGILFMSHPHQFFRDSKQRSTITEIVKKNEIAK